MAKTQKNSRRSSLGGVERMSQAELERELGIDGLTLEACFRGLFGELFEDTPSAAPPEPEADAFTVTQTGPGRRDTHTHEGDEDDAAAT